MLLPQLIISMLLFIVLLFGIGFLLNMLLRKTWVMAISYPVVVILIVDKLKLFDSYKYFTQPGETFSSLLGHLSSLQIADMAILLSGLFGAVLAGVAIKMLRVRGYQMF
ncbi:YuiB family protein [Fictibacillus aquaticus]|uniref:Membrane protein YuiB n=1 Tax=Fictibacillus aquaticus TaxID=2021314 RepID=A0A235F4F6_9BACL|nr:YuiB family protein [Fictibacillus aquaticus]OYD56160.1 hypothetical protein CGZ90_18995 [Fictibacillus aquaticus]